MRSIKNRLALLFLLVAAGAIAVVYLYVVPQLSSSLRDERLRVLEDSAAAFTAPIQAAISGNADFKEIDAAVAGAADRASARVTLLGVGRGTEGTQIYPVSDSSAGVVNDDPGLDVALDAARAREVLSAAESTASGELAEAARPLIADGRVTHVVVFSTPLGDVRGNVAVIRRRVVIAGLLALVIAAGAGYLAARALSRRIKRLERAAEQVAAGDFSHPIPVDSDDELGQLARAFNEMQSQLADLDRARQQFIATASHELRTPLFSLSGFLELLEDEELDDATREHFVTQIREQIARLTRLTTELLDLSKLEAGSLELRAERVDVGDLARTVTAEFTPALHRHDSHLELRLSRPPIEADCDPDRLAQIMRILIDNAIVHTPPGTDIVVTAARNDGRLHLGVCDRGPGIRHGDMGLLFEPFYTSDGVQGSGLGLAIARELAERMAGSLAVASEPGTTTFTLELPA